MEQVGRYGSMVMMVFPPPAFGVVSAVGHIYITRYNNRPEVEDK